MWASEQEATNFIYNSNNHVCHVVIFDTPVIPLKKPWYGQQLRVRIKFGTSLWFCHRQDCKNSDILGDLERRGRTWE